MNIALGLDNYSKMKYMLQMADNLKKKKKLELTMKTKPEKTEKCLLEIEKIKVKGKKVLKKMEDFAAKNPTKAVVAYA